jgi:hypothetical protein
MLKSVTEPGARFLYRISVKGPPCLTLPRRDADEWIAEHIAQGYRVSSSVHATEAM